MILFAAVIAVVLVFIPNKTVQPPDIKTEFEQCRENASACASVDIDDENAGEAYTIGCNKNQYFSCYKLGQYYEIKAENNEAALKAYHKACEGRDSDGCRGEQALNAKK